MGGVGTNYQKRMVAGHSIDIPWRPSDLEQAAGRYARTGNEIAKTFYNNTVHSFLYAKERSLDTFKFNLLKNKQQFIAQMKSGDVTIRRLDEGAFDDSTGMAYTEYFAQLSGNTRLLEKSKLDNQITVLEGSQMIHRRQVATARMDLSAYEAKRNSAIAMLERIKKDKTLYEQNLTHQKDGTKNNPIKLANCRSADAAVLGTFLIDQYKNWNKDIQEELTEKIGNLMGFDLFIRRAFSTVARNDMGYEKIWENRFELKSDISGITYTSNNGIPNIDNPKHAARIFLNAIDKVYGLISHYEKQLEESAASIKVLTGIINQPFEHEEKLLQLKTQQVQLLSEINAEIAAEESRSADHNQSAVENATSATENMAEVVQEAAETYHLPAKPTPKEGKTIKLIPRQEQRKFSKFKSGGRS
jgi:methyl-accepting chemotaxis protein